MDKKAKIRQVPNPEDWNLDMSKIPNPEDQNSKTKKKSQSPGTAKVLITGFYKKKPE